MKKIKPLKWWQGLLIVLSVFALAIGGVFIYLAATNAFNSSGVYPDSFSFKIPEGDDAKNYNSESNQFEVVEDFEITFNSPTEKVNKKNITLSFDKSFSGQGDNLTIQEDADGNKINYIDNGIVKVRQSGKLDEPFNIEIIKNEGVNVGGQVVIYAKSENNQAEIISLKIAVDVAVEGLEIKAQDITTEEYIADFKIIKGANVKFSSVFTPNDSMYAFDKGVTENPRKKDVFYSATQGGTYLTFKYNDGDPYFVASGSVGSKATITAYTFKNAQIQKEFYSTYENLTGEALYNQAINFLSTSTQAKSSFVEVEITDANVDNFSIDLNNTRKDLLVNKEYIFTAGDSNEEYINLGVNITDAKGRVQSGKFADVAIYFADEDIVVNGGSSVEIGGKTYTRLKTAGSNLNNSFWEIYTSKIITTPIEAEIVLLENYSADEYVIWKNYKNEDEIQKITFTFTEPTDLAVEWTDMADINLTIIHSGSGSIATASPVNVKDRINVADRYYKSVVYLVKADILTATTVDEYFNVLNTVKYNGNDYYEIDSDLLVKKAIESVSLYYATVRTDAKGGFIAPSGEDTVYSIVSLSSAIKLSAVDTLQAKDFNMEVSVAEEKDHVISDNNIYYVPTDNGGLKLSIGAGVNKDLLLKEFNAGNVNFYQSDKKFNATTILSGEELTGFTLSMGNMLFEGAISLNIEVRYNNSVRVEKFYEITNKDSKSINLYTPALKSADMILKDVGNEDISGDSFNVKQSINEEGIFVQKWTKGNTDSNAINTITFTAKDQHGLALKPQPNYSYDISNTSVVSIDANGQINLGTTDSEGVNVTIKPNYGMENVDLPTLILNVTSTGINKIERYVEGTDCIVGVTTEEVANLSNIFVARTGYENNEINFTELFKLYSGETKINDNKMSYSLNPSWIGKFTDDEKTMLNEMIEFNNGVAFEDFDSTIEINKIKILKDFGQDFTIDLDIKVAGLTYSASLIIESNVASIENTLIDEYLEDGVYAQFEYSLAGKMTLKKGADVSFASQEIQDEAGNTIGSVLEGNNLKFEEVQNTIENQTITIYSLASKNKYGVKFTTTLKIYTNLKLEVIEGKVDVDFAEVATDGSSLMDHIKISRMAGASDLPTTLTYSITGSNAVKINSVGKIVQNENNILTLNNKEYIELTVSVDDSDINSVNLHLGFADFTMDKMVENNTWITKQLYDGKDYLFVDLSGDKAFASPTDNSNVSASVFANANTVYSKDGNKIVISASKVSSALDSTQNFIVEIQKTDGTKIGRISYPLLISSVGKDFVKYSTNDMNSSDLKNLLEAKIENGELLDNAYDTLTAGSEITIVNDDAKGFIYNSDSATIKDIVVKENYTDKFNVSLASVANTTDGWKLTLNHLAGDEAKYILLEITLKSTKNQKELSYVYRVRVTRNKVVEANEYPIEQGYEFIELNGSVEQKIDLSAKMDNNKYRFNLSDVGTTDVGTTVIDIGKSYIISSVVFGKDNQGNAIEVAYPEMSSNKTLTYTYDGTVFTITLVGSNITFKQTGELKNAQVAVQCLWENVCEGYSEEYKFQINPGEGEVDYYYMEYDGTGVANNTWTCKSTKDVEQTFTVTAKYKQNDFSSEINTNEKTVSAVMKIDGTVINGTTSAGVQTFTYQEIFTVGYKYKDKNLTLTVQGFVDKDYEIIMDFYVGGRLAQNSLTIKLPGSIQATIEESLAGGTTHGWDNVVSNITNFGELETISIPNLETFLNIDDTNKELIVADLIEDATAELKFEFKNTDGTYTVTKEITFTSNMTIPEAHTVSGKITSGEEKEIPIVSEMNKGSLTATCSDSRIASVSINENGKLKIKPAYVSETTTFSVNISITYTFNSSYKINKTLALTITVKPDVTPKVNYPTSLDYESYKVGNDQKEEIGNIKTFLLEETAPLAEGKRVVFTGGGDDPYTIKINDLSFAKVKVDNKDKVIGETISDTITLEKETGAESYVEFSVTYHEVTAIYRIYLVNNDVVTLAVNGTINTVSENNKQVETLYLDKQEDKKVFNGKRLVEVAINNASKLSLSEIYYAVSDNIQIPFRIRSDLKRDGMVFCLDAGKTLIGTHSFTIRRGSANGTIVSGENLGFDSNIIIRSRVEHRYTLKDNSYKVVEVGYTVEGIIDRADYEVSGDLNSGELVINSSVVIGVSTKYSYKIGLDFQVEMEIANGSIIEIEAHKEYSLIDQAGIRKLSTGEKYTKNDFNESKSIKIETVNVDTTNDPTNNLPAYEGIKFKPNSSPRYLIYQPLQNNGNIYDYTLYADGAENNGSYVLLKITYTVVDGTEITKYIVVKIIPDTIVKFNGGVLAEAETVESVDNSLNPYVVEYKNSSYSIELAKSSTGEGSSLLEIKNKNHNSNKDIAYTWTYTIKTKESKDGYTYNEDPTLYNYYNDTENWIPSQTTDPVGYTKSNGGAITILRDQAIHFGTKRLLIHVTNVFGYEIDLYFNLKPADSEQPEVDTSSSDRSFTEGDKFDIGVLYDLITPVAEDTISVDKVAYNGTEFNPTGITAIKDDNNEIIGKYGKIGDVTYAAKGDTLSKDNVCQANGLKIGSIGAGYTISETGTRYKYAFRKCGSGSDSIAYYADAQDNLLVWRDGGLKFAVVGPVTLVEADTTLRPSIETKAPTTDAEGLKIVNLSGINAWGFSADSYAPDINGEIEKDGNKIKRFNNANLLDLSKLTLKNIKVKKIDFLNSDGKSVGSIPEAGSISEDLATSSELKWAGMPVTLTVTLPGDSSVAVEMKLKREGEDTINAQWSQTNNSSYAKTYYVSMSNRFGTVVRSTDTITLTFKNYDTSKTINDHVGFYAVINGNSIDGNTDGTEVTRVLSSLYRNPEGKYTIPTLDGDAYMSNTAPTITMKIALEYADGTTTESCEILYNITVQRQVKITNTEKTVRDGVEFDIPITVDKSSEIYDDTLTVTLPGDSSVAVEMKLKREGEDTINAQWSQTNNSSYAKTYYVSMSNRFGTVVRSTDTITLTFKNYDTSKTINDHVGFYAVINGNTTSNTTSNAVSNTVMDGNNSCVENLTLSSITQDTINLEDSAQINQNSVYTTRTKYYVIKSEGKYYLHSVTYNVTRRYPYLDQGLGNQTYKEVSEYCYVGDEADETAQYVIPFDKWTAGMTFYGPKYSNGVSQGDETITPDPTHFKFQISVNGEEGAAEIYPDGTIITKANIGLKPGSNVYLEVRMYAKVSGCDGSFSSTSDYDSTYFGENGSGIVKILLSSSTTTSTSSITKLTLNTAAEDISGTLIKGGDKYIAIGEKYYLISKATSTTTPS